jgi:hypothetical protein
LCLESGTGGIDVCKNIHKRMAGKHFDIFFGHLDDGRHGFLEFIRSRRNNTQFFGNVFVVVSSVCGSSDRFRRFLFRIQGQCLDLSFFSSYKKGVTLDIQVCVPVEHPGGHFYYLLFCKKVPPGIG